MASVAALLLGLALTWAFGTALVAAVYRVAPPRETPNVAWVLGLGWFVGTFALTLLMRALSAAGVAFGIASIGGPLVLLTLALGAYAWRGRGVGPGQALRCMFRALAGHGLEGWQKRAWQALCAWLALRFALLLCEVWWRPLYPWDAWMQWATKARVWFEHARDRPVRAVRHLAAGETAPCLLRRRAALSGDRAAVAGVVGGADRALGRRAHQPAVVVHRRVDRPRGLRLPAPRRPAGAGRTRRRLARGLTLPIANVHVALAGYADLPMACYVTLAALAGLALGPVRSAPRTCCSCCASSRLPTIKNPGKAWVVLLLPGLAVAALAALGAARRGAIVGAGAAGAADRSRRPPGCPRLPDPVRGAFPWQGLFDAYFLYANWHLLWFRRSRSRVCVGGARCSRPTRRRSR